MTKINFARPLMEKQPKYFNLATLVSSGLGLFKIIREEQARTTKITGFCSTLLNFMSHCLP